MNKNIGFRRNIYREWLDAAAAFRSDTQDVQKLRTRLDAVVAQQVASTANRRMAVDILVNIWTKSAQAHPALQADAVAWFAQTTDPTDRLWLHYGMTVLTYSFFRLGVVAIGQLSRHTEVITTKELEQRLAAELGPLGSLKNATERIVFSLRNWGLLAESDRRYGYRPLRRTLGASRPDLEEWMLAAILTAHPAEELPFDDLVRLPELFPFRFAIGVDRIRKSARFEVHRQGAGWDMVRVVQKGSRVPAEKPDDL
ncbi:MAG: hypothetical protein NT169_03075 [Chloroflexi bacterium]|nr:hypothetical protein [Chloroflexota bacterium]